jgi:DnaJ-class molecular chaperone
MSKVCKACKGRGTYQVKETYSDGDEALLWYECNDCAGTGESQEVNDDEPFNFNGDIDD